MEESVHTAATVPPFSAEPGYTMLGWPDHTPCVRCGADAAHLCSTVNVATYECRGTPVEKGSAYGPDACYAVFDLHRSEEKK